jgi:enoyl-CoA hydratase/carnithine racemase
VSDLEYMVADGVATILLNRPEKKNAFTMAMVEDWARLLFLAQATENVRAIVVSGAGDAFCAGVDLDRFQGTSRTPLQQKRLLMGQVHRVALALEHVDKPVIAGVNGAAVGAGMDMALLCDIRIGSPTARFSEGYIRVGLVPGNGGCWLLPRIVGASTALRLLWTGDFVSADEALRLGLLDEIAGDARSAACTLASRLAGMPPVAIQIIKRAVRQGANQDLPTALDLMSSHAAVVSTTDDAKEAYASFRAQRPGRFYGR